MKKQLRIRDLGKTQLWRLRQDIVLNSLFLNDYENRYGISAKQVCDFMDGYLEELYYIANEDGFDSEDVFDVIEKYDSKDNLYNYACSIIWED